MTLDVAMVVSMHLTQSGLQEKQLLRSLRKYGCADLPPDATGDVWLIPLVTGNDVQTQMVTFAPGCINDYHIHHGSEQTIICTGGRGWYQEEGKPAIEMKPGDAIAIPVEVRHWHGAAKDSWFSHIVVYSKAHEGFHAEWCEPVPQEIYDGLE